MIYSCYFVPLNKRAIIPISNDFISINKGHMASSKEAKARIKISKLLEESGWRFEDSEKVS